MSEYMIMLSGKCNLNCPYCFAENSMRSFRGDISETAFEKAVEFGLSSNHSSGIGIIGGEPTLHHNFDKLINKLIINERVKSIDIFTNGTTITQHLSVFSSYKVFTLINCNSEYITGNKLQSEIIGGIDSLFKLGVPISRIGLGFNLYKLDEDLDFYLSLVDRYKMDTVRISISVPNCNTIVYNRFDFFKQHINQTQLFIRALLDRGVVPIFDCNKIPICLLSEENEQLMERYKNRFKSLYALSKTNYLNGYSRCTPSIVVDGNLNAVRCFALSEVSRVSILDFENLESLQEYYEKEIDALGYVSDCSECKDCEKLIYKHCMGGCLVFKQRK